MAGRGAWIAVLMVLMVLGYASGRKVKVLPSDRRLTYSGRFLFPDNGNTSAKFGWVGTAISLFAATSSLSVNLSAPAGGSRWQLVVDGAARGEPVGLNGSFDGVLLLAESLDANVMATYELVKVTEDGAQDSDRGVATFRGFELSAGAVLGAARAPAARRLEFLGDSDTAGYCAQPPGRALHTSENHYVTWASKLARALNASHTAEAISGIGVKDSRIQPHLESTLPFDGSSVWGWQCDTAPDAVVILLGPNDDTASKKSQQKFVKDYRSLMELLDEKYRGCGRTSALISVCGGSGNGLDCCPFIKRAIESYTGGISARYVSIDETLWSTLNEEGSRFLGCDGH